MPFRPLSRVRTEPGPAPCDAHRCTNRTRGDELGYRPNLTARHLRKGRTGILAPAVPELGNPYFAELAGAVIDVAAEHEYTVLLDHTGGRREKEILVSQGFRARVIDGLILSPIELARRRWHGCGGGATTEDAEHRGRPGGPCRGRRPRDHPGA